jgi:mono/diheme cytochrome c family protein
VVHFRFVTGPNLDRPVFQSWICGKGEIMQRLWLGASLGLLFLCCSIPTDAADNESGKDLLQRNCGRCHALAPGTLSPLKEAPNLWIVLRSYPTERLEFELAEGIGSRHKDMPQIQFSSDDIYKIEGYLSGDR